MTTNDLSKDSFGIPILPTDEIYVNENRNLNAKVYIFTSIEPSKETYIEVTFEDIATNRVLPSFTYIKPSPKGKDPRENQNIEYVDENKLGKVRKGYVLLGLIPSEDSDFDKAWGMRNHLHKAVDRNNPGIVCAVYDDKSNLWSTRTYFEIDSVQFVGGGDVLEECLKL